MLGTAEQRHAAAATVAAIQSSRLSDLLELFFFVNSGSEVAEAALKVARSIMHRQNIITMQGQVIPGIDECSSTFADRQLHKLLRGRELWRTLHYTQGGNALE